MKKPEGKWLANSFPVVHIKRRTLFSIGIALLLLVGFSYFLQQTLLSQEQSFTLWLRSFGPYLILVYVLVQVAAIVIPPIPGVFISLPILAIFGPFHGLLLIYLTTTPAECLNFFIAKKYGRGAVEKLFGKKNMIKIDSYSRNAGVDTAIVLKLFEDNYFDYISYGLGLTPITLKQFVFINFLVGIPRLFLSYFILTKAPNFTAAIVLLEITAALFTGSYLFWRYWRVRAKKKDDGAIGPLGEIN